MNLKPVKHSSPPDVIGLLNDEFGGIFSKRFSEEVSAFLVEAIAEDSNAYLPIYWGRDDGIGGPAVSDPLAIYIGLPLKPAAEKPSDEINCYFSVSFDDLITEFLQDAHENNDGLLSKEGAKQAVKVRDRLLRLADKISAVLPKRHS